MILDSKNIKYEVVDIAEPGNEEAKEFMQSNSTCIGATIGDANPKYPLPPQIFNEQDYCGDYDKFDLSNELDEIEKFLKLSPEETPDSVTSTADMKIENGVSHTETENLTADDNEAEAKQEPEHKEDNSLSEEPVGDNEVTASETDNVTEKVDEEIEEKIENDTEEADNITSNENNVPEEEETA